MVASFTRNGADVSTPTLTFAFTIWLDFAHVISPEIRRAPMISGRTYGQITVTGGRFAGPRLRGQVLAGGGDYAHVRPDGYPMFDARYLLEEEDGTVIEFFNRGLREPAPGREDPTFDPEAEAVYFRLWPVLTAPEGPHAWLSRTVFVGAGRRADVGNRIDYFAVSG